VGRCQVFFFPSFLEKKKDVRCPFFKILYVSSCCYMCVFMLLYMCPHASIYMSSASPRHTGLSRMCEHKRNRYTYMRIQPQQVYIVRRYLGPIKALLSHYEGSTSAAGIYIYEHNRSRYMYSKALLRRYQGSLKAL
jgi:hypothetical protein